jgi:hypothetical protein
MQFLSRGYTPYIGHTRIVKMTGRRARLWITREKLWIKGVYWGELVQISFFMYCPIPPYMGDALRRSPSEFLNLWDGEYWSTISEIIPGRPGDRILRQKPYISGIAPTPPHR